MSTPLPLLLARRDYLRKFILYTYFDCCLTQECAFFTFYVQGVAFLSISAHAAMSSGTRPSACSALTTHIWYNVLPIWYSAMYHFSFIIHTMVLRCSTVYHRTLHRTTAHVARYVFISRILLYIQWMLLCTTGTVNAVEQFIPTGHPPWWCLRICFPAGSRYPQLSHPLWRTLNA